MIGKNNNGKSDGTMRKQQNINETMSYSICIYIIYYYFQHDTVESRLIIYISTTYSSNIRFIFKHIMLYIERVEVNTLCIHCTFKISFIFKIMCTNGVTKYAIYLM